jgi:NAD-dependent SIR2 family protein deacetylase
MVYKRGKGPGSEYTGLSPVEIAARIIDEADGLVITAGAGMGVDSGLPDFRGNQGFWEHYPALGKAGVGFTSIANPQAFRRQPERAWGFYGHRLQLYRDTVPHEGFHILRRWAALKSNRAVVITSNVDGQFQKAGFAHGKSDAQEDIVNEVHGSIHHLQCLKGCCDDIWSADGFDPVVDTENCLLISDLPKCPHCGGLARPNILMFGDGGWVNKRSDWQEVAVESVQRRIKKRVVIELGAGIDIPTIRWFGENWATFLIRINPAERSEPECGVTLPMGALRALREIDEVISRTHGEQRKAQC